MISSPYYASIIERLHCATLGKRGGKVVLLPQSTAPVHKCNTAIRKIGFIDLNDPVCFLHIASSDYYLFSNLNKFLRDKNFSRDDKTINTVEDYLNNLDLRIFL